MGKRKDSREFWTTDCETDPFKYGRIPKPFVWGLFTGHRFVHYADTDELIRDIYNNPVIVYAHNGGKFDFHYLLEKINLREELKVINGRLVCANIGQAELRDSWNILPVPLREFGSKLEIDYAKLEPDVREKHMPEILEYLKVDCVDLWHNVFAFEERHGRHLTQAGASLDLWKKTSGLKAPKSDADFFDKFSPYYYGGRVEVFQAGHVKGPLKYFDIRSAYPWAMLSEHPYEVDYVTIDRPKEIRATSMVTLNCVSHGCLPFRDDKGSITFPNDNEKRTYHATGHEILAGIETGTISHIEYLTAYDFTGLVSFAGYINPLYEERKRAREAGQVAKAVLIKLNMNSLYGKFCANPRNYGNYMCVPFSEIQNYEADGYTFDGMIGPWALLRSDLDPWQENFLNVATGASITGKVRAHLWRAICASERPIYCDTDSLICEDADLPIGPDLGQWNLEGVASDAWVAGKKLYYMTGKFEKGAKEKKASKGVKLEGREIKRAATGGTVTALNDAPTFSILKPIAWDNPETMFQKRRVRATAGNR